MLIWDQFCEWIKFQKNWIYLENIFAAGDIKRSMMHESKEFDVLNVAYRNNSKKVNSTPSPHALVRNNFLEKVLLNNFKNANVTLNYLNKKIDDFLNEKRGICPRFYFVANDELI